MLPFPNIDPVIFSVGPLQLRWYGLMYVLGFLGAYFLIRGQDRAKRIGLQGQSLQDLIFFVAIGLVVGARLGYVLFYQYANLWEYVRHPLEIIAVWQGGMSFHGGLIGAALAGILFSWRRGMPLPDLADAVIVTAPIGLGFGRLGNFINGELYGRPSSVPWAMIFPDGGPLPRHPSQLYEAALEGLLLFVLLWRLKDMNFRPGAMVSFFLAGYGVFRLFVEFFREPDLHIGLFWGVFSMGQLLSIAMILTALVLWRLLPSPGVKA
jgi:phosphatidylglycerol---prolipoprotein diacylglyceryl transferase